MNQILQHLKKSSAILVCSHMDPDGDAVGSLIALGLALEHLNKNTTLYNESPIPTVYRFLPSVRRIRRHIPKGAVYDAVLVLDCGTLDRIGKMESALGTASCVINLDHHHTNSRFGDLQLVDPSACATAEIVYRLIQALKIPINRDIAFAIYTAIFTDTGSFRFANTNQAAFSICEEMIGKGVDPFEVAQHVYGEYSLGRIKLLNLALDSIEISDNGKLSLMTLSQNMLKATGTKSHDIVGLINYARRIKSVKVAALIQELCDDNTSENGARNYHVSLRSVGKVDVSDIALSYGGGGHLNAAGFNIRSTLEDIKSKVFGLADRLN